MIFVCLISLLVPPFCKCGSREFPFPSAKRHRSLLLYNRSLTSSKAFSRHYITNDFCHTTQALALCTVLDHFLSTSASAWPVSAAGTRVSSPHFSLGLNCCPRPTYHRVFLVIIPLSLTPYISQAIIRPK